MRIIKRNGLQILGVYQATSGTPIFSRIPIRMEYYYQVVMTRCRNKFNVPGNDFLLSQNKNSRLILTATSFIPSKRQISTAGFVKSVRNTTCK